MSKENAKKFMEEFNSGVLKDKVEAALKNFQGNKSDAKAVFDEAIAPVAKEAGYDFNYEDAPEIISELTNGELPLDVLKATTGGGTELLDKRFM